jgi:TonB family protein
MHLRFPLCSFFACCLAAGALGACAAKPPPEPDAPAAEPEPSAASNAEPTPAEPAPSDNSASTSAAPSAGASTTASSDSRTLESIRAVVGANRQKVRDCYDAALKTNPDIVGDLVVSFVIDPQGKVKTAEVNWKESDIHVPELDTCAVAAIRSLSFPPSSKGLESTVNYPFNLNPKQMPPKASKN